MDSLPDVRQAIILVAVGSLTRRMAFKRVLKISSLQLRPRLVGGKQSPFEIASLLALLAKTLYFLRSLSNLRLHWCVDLQCPIFQPPLRLLVERARLIGNAGGYVQHGCCVVDKRPISSPVTIRLDLVSVGHYNTLPVLPE